MPKLKLKSNRKKIQYILYLNSVDIGYIEINVDGFYYFWDDKYNTGSWSANSLRMIADLLNKMNKKWNDKIKELH